MSLKYLKPQTPSSRSSTFVSRSGLWSGKPHKALLVAKASTGGRNSYGRITVRHRGGAHKKRYRIINFKYHGFSSARVERVEYDPNRTSFIALVKCIKTGKFFYVPAVANTKRGDLLRSDSKSPDKGNLLRLGDIPVGSEISCIEIKIGCGAQLVRSAGTSARLVGRIGSYVLVKLPSGTSLRVSSDCKALIGSISNPDHKNIKLGKAGRKRWLGFRPSVRGVAMNPVDHPHGGGEGRTSGGRHPVTPWGFGTKGSKTVIKKKRSMRFFND